MYKILQIIALIHVSGPREGCPSNNKYFKIMYLHKHFRIINLQAVTFSATITNI